MGDGTSSFATVRIFAVPITLTRCESGQQYAARSQKRMIAAVWKITLGGAPVAAKEVERAARTDCNEVMSVLTKDTEGWSRILGSGGLTSKILMLVSPRRIKSRTMYLWKNNQRS